MYKANKDINGELFPIDSTAKSHFGLGGACWEVWFILMSIIQILHLDRLSEVIDGGCFDVIWSATAQAA